MWSISHWFLGLCINLHKHLSINITFTLVYRTWKMFVGYLANAVPLGEQGLNSLTLQTIDFWVLSRSQMLFESNTQINKSVYFLIRALLPPLRCSKVTHWTRLPFLAVTLSKSVMLFVFQFSLLKSSVSDSTNLVVLNELIQIST